MSEQNSLTNSISSENREQIQFVDAQDAVKDTSYLKSILDNMNGRFNEEFEHAQGRSNFQIEKFVAMNDFTISSRYKHVLKNAMVTRKELFRVIKEGIETQREFEYKWKDKNKNEPLRWKGRGGDERLCWYDTDEFENIVFMQDLAISIKDKVQQLAFFDQILDALQNANGGPITKEQFDLEEPKYWERRFKKQIADEMIARQTGINGGNIESVRNATAPTIIPNSINRVDHFPSLDVILHKPEEFLLELQKDLIEGYSEINEDFRVTFKPQEHIQLTNKPDKEENLSHNRLDKSITDLGIGKIVK